MAVAPGNEEFDKFLIRKYAIKISGPSAGRESLKMLCNTEGELVRILLPPPYFPNKFNHNSLIYLCLIPTKTIHSLLRSSS